jgi:hypothetical protein
VRKLLQELKNNKEYAHTDILVVDNIDELKVLDFKGPYGFEKFIE